MNFVYIKLEVFFVGIKVFFVGAASCVHDQMFILKLIKASGA